MISIRLNGEVKTLDRVMTVREMLDHFGLPQQGVAVERNRAIVPKSRHGEEALADGDIIEMIHFVGGG